MLAYVRLRESQPLDGLARKCISVALCAPFMNNLIDLYGKYIDFITKTRI